MRPSFSRCAINLLTLPDAIVKPRTNYRERKNLLEAAIDAFKLVPFPVTDADRRSKTFPELLSGVTNSFPTVRKLACRDYLHEDRCMSMHVVDAYEKDGPSGPNDRYVIVSAKNKKKLPMHVPEGSVVEKMYLTTEGLHFPIVMNRVYWSTKPAFNHHLYCDKCASSKYGLNRFIRKASCMLCLSKTTTKSHGVNDRKIPICVDCNGELTRGDDNWTKYIEKLQHLFPEFTMFNFYPNKKPVNANANTPDTIFDFMYNGDEYYIMIESDTDCHDTISEKDEITRLDSIFRTLHKKAADKPSTSKGSHRLYQFMVRVNTTGQFKEATGKIADCPQAFRILIARAWITAFMLRISEGKGVDFVTVMYLFYSHDHRHISACRKNPTVNKLVVCNVGPYTRHWVNYMTRAEYKELKSIGSKSTKAVWTE